MPIKRKLRVYGWSHGGLSRVIVAAYNKLSVDKAWRGGRDYISETGNEIELQVALANPFTIFIERPRGSKQFHPMEDEYQHMRDNPALR